MIIRNVYWEEYKLQQKEGFINWLQQETTLAHSTIEKYAGAIITISKGLKKCEFLESSLYYITDPTMIESYSAKYLSISEFSAKDIRGNRMYSNALKRYKEYLQSDY